MWKYLNVRQRDVDPSPEVRAQMNVAVEFCFKFAEYTLIAGVFAFLAIATKHWAVIAIACVLALLLTVHMMTMISGLQFFVWRDAKSWWSKTLLFVLDSALFLGLWWTLLQAFVAVFKTMSGGVAVFKTMSGGIGI
jgi:hypothetical protein